MLFANPVTYVGNQLTVGLVFTDPYTKQHSYFTCTNTDHTMGFEFLFRWTLT